MRGRWKSIVMMAIFASGAVVVWRCVAFTPASALLLVDQDGQPVFDAYAAFHHHSDVFNFVDSLTVDVPGPVIRPDAEGELRIPARLALKHPLHSQPEARLHFLYAPAQHNALVGVVGMTPVPGVLDVEQNPRRLVVHDLVDDPLRWERSLGQLYSAIRFELWPAPAGSHRRTQSGQGAIPALLEAMRLDLASFRARHTRTLRQPPSAEETVHWPESERASRMARIEADLAAAPTWGDYLDRHWNDRLTKLQAEADALGLR